jgi:uroporphyrinogen decarboxylase
MGVNLFNMAFDTDLNLLKEKTGHRVTMLGNIPPRDVLARGSEEEIRASANALRDKLEDPSRVIFSCGGGMPPGVTTAQIRAFIETIQNP